MDWKSTEMQAMNTGVSRRRFLELLGMATAGATVAYSFPSIIVPKNIIPVESVIRQQGYNLAPRGLIYLIDSEGWMFGSSVANFTDLNRLYLTYRKETFT